MIPLPLDTFFIILISSWSSHAVKHIWSWNFYSYSYSEVLCNFYTLAFSKRSLQIILWSTFLISFPSHTSFLVINSSGSYYFCRFAASIFPLKSGFLRQVRSVWISSKPNVSIPRWKLSKSFILFSAWFTVYNFTPGNVVCIINLSFNNYFFISCLKS